MNDLVMLVEQPNISSIEKYMLLRRKENVPIQNSVASLCTSCGIMGETYVLAETTRVTLMIPNMIINVLYTVTLRTSLSKICDPVKFITYPT